MKFSLFSCDMQVLKQVTQLCVVEKTCHKVAGSMRYGLLMISLRACSYIVVLPSGYFPYGNFASRTLREGSMIQKVLRVIACSHAILGIRKIHALALSIKNYLLTFMNTNFSSPISRR